MYMGFIHLFLDPSLKVPSYIQIKGRFAFLPSCKDTWSSSASICNTSTPLFFGTFVFKASRFKLWILFLTVGLDSSPSVTFIELLA